MVTQLERIENELKIAGYRLEPVKENFESDDDYVQAIGTCVYEICKKFSEQDHSGMSANIAIRMITKLLQGDILTPLTDNPEEWVKHFEGEEYYQSKRKFSCFSTDLKQYYDIEADENKVFELDENGEKTGYYHLKKDKVMHNLTHYEG